MNAGKGTLLLLIAALIETSFQETCTPSKCVRPRCFCSSSEFPLVEGIHNSSDIPQFVMLSFNGAVSPTNFPFYEELLSPKRTNPDNCRIRATFFIQHKFTNYSMVNYLYRTGNEIGSNSVSHGAPISDWANKSESENSREMQAVREIAEKYAHVPREKIVGARAPFLQTSGDKYFAALARNLFLYDSSMPTQRHANYPIWPYTLDYGYSVHENCVAPPCPKQRYPHLWEVPLLNYFKDGTPCATPDSCPNPESAEATESFLYDNFNRHYGDSKAPFPVFTSVAWFGQHPTIKEGYLRFIDKLLTLPDVYLVTIQEVIAYMMNPRPLDEYKKQKCHKDGAGCKDKNCTYYDPPFPENVITMYVCNDTKCPRNYPWLDKLEGY